MRAADSNGVSGVFRVTPVWFQLHHARKFQWPPTIATWM